MASPAEYIIQTQHTSGSTAKHYHGVSISTLNEWAKNNIPKYAIVSSIQVRYSGKCSLGDTYVYVGFSKSSSKEPGDELINDQLTTKQKTWNGNITSYSSTWPFNINTSYSTLSVYMNSGILYKKFTCYDFRVIYNYYIPSYTLTVKAGTGGTVSGGGTVEAGGVVTITATPNAGYKFKQWNDGDTSDTRSFALYSDATYTAEFEPIEYRVTVGCNPSESGEKCDIKGTGTYKFGDTVSIEAINIPKNHKFDFWSCGTGLGLYEYYYTNPLTVTLTEDFIEKSAEGDNLINFACFLEHTGFNVKANVSPNSEAGYVKEGIWLINGDSEVIILEDIVPVDGFSVSYADRANVIIGAVPNAGYEFLRWQDGDTSNPRKIVVTDDKTYTAYFGINRVLADNYKAKKVLLNLDKVKALLLHNTKVYES